MELLEPHGPQIQAKEAQAMTTIQQLPAHPAVTDQVPAVTQYTAPAAIALMGPAGPGSAIPLMGSAAPGAAVALMGSEDPGSAIPLMGSAAPAPRSR